VGLLVVKENIGLIGSQEFGFVHTAKKNGLVNTDIPRSQGANHPLVGGR
jgi:hypothetical protein